jgi:hypothetical protein
MKPASFWLTSAYPFIAGRFQHLLLEYSYLQQSQVQINTQDFLRKRRYKRKNAGGYHEKIFAHFRNRNNSPMIDFGKTPMIKATWHFFTPTENQRQTSPRKGLRRI